MRLTTDQYQLDRRKMEVYIARLLPEEGTRIVIADGPDGQVWADLCPIWDEEDGWDLYFETNCRDWVDLREIYEHFHKEKMTVWERRRELNGKLACLRVQGLEKELNSLRSEIARPSAPVIQGPHVYTTIEGNNADLMQKVAALYFKPGYRIADVTFGRGVFWKHIDLSGYDLCPSDLLTCPQASYDFRCLPYADSDFHVHVFDPPYCHNPGTMMVNSSYKNKETTQGLNHAGIIQLYREGMQEGYRILMTKGLMLLKCQDEIESSKQKMSHIEIHDIAVNELGLKVKDLFVLKQRANPVIQHKAQKHARKNHSYLWVFEKK